MDSWLVSRYMIRSEAPRLNTKSARYIVSCLLSFILDLNDQNLFTRKLNQKTMDSAAEFEAKMDNPKTSLNTNSKANSIAALLKPVTR